MKQPTSTAEVALSYCRSKASLLDAKLERAQFRCTEYDEGDPSIGDDGTPRCDQDATPELMCEQCKKRQDAHKVCVELSKAATRHWRQYRSLNRPAPGVLQMEARRDISMARSMTPRHQD